MNRLLITFFTCISLTAFSQDTLPPPSLDTSLRIIDLNPFFSLHVDSTLNYQLEINKPQENYFWYLRSAPYGLKIVKETGIINFRADKAFFLSGKLKYDQNYKVLLGVQNLKDPSERIDTSFTIVFFNTDIVSSKLKPTVSKTIVADEGEQISFRVFCENGSFPIENIMTVIDAPIGTYKPVQQCGDEFSWSPSFDFVKDRDQEKAVTVQFIGTTKFLARDTIAIKMVIRNALDYTVANQDYQQAVHNVQRYVLQLKYTFLQLDKRLRKTKNTRTTFDLTSATTSVTGTIMSTSSNNGAQRTGKILPSVGLALVPIKEAAVPNKSVDQNQAAAIRTSIKRLEYMIQDNQTVGDKDPLVVAKTQKLKDELKQVQVQLIEVPIEIANNMSEEELDRYFNSPKVNKKYRLKRR